MLQSHQHRVMKERLDASLLGCQWHPRWSPVQIYPTMPNMNTHKNTEIKTVMGSGAAIWPPGIAQQMPYIQTALFLVEFKVSTQGDKWIKQSHQLLFQTVGPTGWGCGKIEARECFQSTARGQDGASHSTSPMMTLTAARSLGQYRRDGWFCPGSRAKPQPQNTHTQK